MTGAGAGAAPSGPSELTPKSLSVRGTRGFLWAALSFGSSRIIVFLVTLGLTRLLAPADFGVVAAGLTLIAFLEIALDLGVGAAVVYEQEEGLTHRVRTAYTLNLLIAVGLAGLGVLAAPAIASFFHAEQSVGLFRALFGYLVLRGGSQVQASVLQRDLRYRERTIIDIVRALVRGGTSIGLAAVGGGALAIVAGLLAGEAVGLVLTCSIVRLRPALRLQRSVVTALLRYGVAVLGLKVVSALLTNADNLIVGNRLGTTALGLYAIAFRLPELCIDSVHWIFSSIAFSLYSQARQRGPEVFRNAMLRSLRLTTVFGFSAGTGLAVVAPVAVPVLFSDRWAGAVEATVLLSLATGLASIGYASGDIFPALGRPGTLLKLTAVTTVAALVGFWLTAPYGIAAVAAVHLAFQLVFGVLRLRVANRLVGSSWGQDLAAMTPAVASSLGIACLALPVAVIVPSTVLGLSAIVVAGLAGSAVGLALFGRPAVRDIVGLLRGSRPARQRGAVSG